MYLKEISLKKGMDKTLVNNLVGKWLHLKDDVYLGNKHKHNWECRCGNGFTRTWDNLRRQGSITCGCIEFNTIENKYKTEVEKDGKYKYIRSFRNGDIKDDGKLIKNRPYLKIKHLYCGNVFTIAVNAFRNMRDECTKCCGSYEKSFAYHIEVELGEALEKYWDFEKNTVNPYHINKYSEKKIFIKCQNKEKNKLNGLVKKDYHKSYETNGYIFYIGARCSYCSPSGRKEIHPYDSFGYHNLDKVQSWHPDNNISPFKVSCGSGKKYKMICWICGNIWESNVSNLNKGRWCSKCDASEGEKRIVDYLNKRGFNYIYDYPIFDDLMGAGGGLLRPDFILPNHKIWIEYDGEFHYKDICKDGRYKRQVYHDKLKNEYAQKHGWKMIRIPYWEFDNIEDILKRELRV